MINVAYLPANPDNACSWYRSTGVLPYLNSPKITLTDFSEKNLFSHSTWINVDIFFFQRPSTHEHVQIINIAKAMNCRVIIDYDDALLHIPDYYTAYEKYEANRDNIIHCFSLADEVWVSTQGIKDLYEGYNRNMHVIPNAHNDYVFKVENKKPFNSNSSKVFYRGCAAVEPDLYKHLFAFVDVVKQNPEWEFNFMGTRFPFLESLMPDNYVMSNPMKLIDYFINLNEYNPNLAFYPLNDTVFNRCKSNISFLEATYAGAAFLGNIQLPEFQNVPCYGITDLGNWITQCMQDKEELEGMNNYAWSYILEHRLLSSVNNLRRKRLLAHG